METAEPEILRQEIVRVHRAWIPWYRDKNEQREMVAAVPLRVLQKFAKQIPHNAPASVQDFIRRYYQYYLAQLWLFHEVAYMRNYCGMDTIKRMLPERVVFSGMNEVLWPP